MNIQVKDMGAVGDGTADDTTAIQQRYNQPLTCVQSPEEVSW